MPHNTNKSAKTQSHSELNSSISLSESDVSTKDGEAGESQPVPEPKKTRRRIELSEKSRERVKQFLKNKETPINQSEKTQRGSGSPPTPMSHTVFYEDYDKPLKNSDVMDGAKRLISEQLELLKVMSIPPAVQATINLLTKFVENKKVTFKMVASCMALLKNEYEFDLEEDYSKNFFRCHQILTDLYNFFDSKRTKERSSNWSIGAPLATESANDPQAKKLVSQIGNPKEARESDFKAILKLKLQRLQESPNKTKDLSDIETFLRSELTQAQSLKGLTKTFEARKKEAPASLTAEQMSINAIISAVLQILNSIKSGEENLDQYIKKLDDVIGLIDRYESSNLELQFKLPTSESPQNKPTGPGSGSSSVNSSLKSDFSTENTAQQKIIAEVEVFLGDFENKMSIFLKGKIWNQEEVNNLKGELAIGISKFKPRTINLLTNSGTIGPDLKLKSDECQKRVAYLKLRLELMLIPENDFKGELHLGPISSYIDFLKGLESKLDEEINMADKQTLTDELSQRMAMINKLKPRDLPVEKEVIPQSLNSLIEKLQARAKTIKEKLEAKNSSSY